MRDIDRPSTARTGCLSDVYCLVLMSTLVVNYFAHS